MPNSTMQALIEALRGGGYTRSGGEHTYGPSAQSPLNPNREPAPKSKSLLPTKMRGYQLYIQEAKVNDEPIMSYKKWFESQ